MTMATSITEISTSINEMTTSSRPMKYAILKRTTRLQLPAVATELDAGTEKMQYFTAPAGTLVKVITQNPASEESNNALVSSSAAATVQVYDAVRRAPCTDCCYRCPAQHLLAVDDAIWPFMLSIAEPQQRLRVLQDDCLREWLLNVRPNELVSVPSQFFEINLPNELRYDGIIRYIGPVPELHAVGYFFGVELVYNDALQNILVSPQSADIPFARNYIECDATEAIFTTADWILPTPMPESEQPPEKQTASEEPNSWSITNIFKSAWDSINPLRFG